MQVVTAREFRNSQGKFLNAAKRGNPLMLRSKFGDFRITPINANDSFERDIKSACKEIKAYMAGDIELPLAKDLKF